MHAQLSALGRLRARAAGRRGAGEDPARDAASVKSWVSWGISGPGRCPEPRSRWARLSTSRSEHSERPVRARARSLRARGARRRAPRGRRRARARSLRARGARRRARGARRRAPRGRRRRGRRRVGTPEMTLPAPYRTVPIAGIKDGCLASRMLGSQGTSPELPGQELSVGVAPAHAFQCIGKIRPERGSIQAIADSVGGSDPSKIARAQAVDDPGWRVRRNCGYFATS